MDNLIQLVGYLGSLLILLSFILVTRGVWKPQEVWYLLVNFIGAFMLAAYQIWLEANAGVLLNVVFAVVALVGLSHLKSHKYK